LGGFITTLPENIHLNDTSIYTTPLKFSADSFPSPSIPNTSSPAGPLPDPISEGEDGGILEGEDEDGILEGGDEEGGMLEEVDDRKRQWDIIESITNGVKSASSAEGGAQELDGSEGGGVVYEVPTYTGPVHYKVPKTGYYCVGMSLLLTSLGL
jgi:hypothetical protein